MEEQKSFSDKFLDGVMKIVYKVLRKENLLQSEFHLGKVESVISPTKLRAYIDGGTTAQLVYSNPNVVFEVGDEIFVVFVNRDSKSKYAISKRALEYDYPEGAVSPHHIILSNENQSIPTDSTGKTETTITITSTVDTLKGNERVPSTIGLLVLKDSSGAAITTSGVTLNKQDPTDTESGTITMTINPAVNLSADIGYIEIPIIIEGNAYIKKLTWNKSKEGRDGQDGYTPVKGTDYFDGVDGQDGTSSYLWIGYSQNANGNPMTTDPTGALYIGTATTSTDTAPASYSSYTWTLIKGTDGIPGEKGADGRTSYLHIKYSDDGFSFTANNGESVGKWIGTYVDFTQADSNVFTDYTWNKVKGEDGYTPVKGVDYFDGIDGQNGVSSYLWVRYSQNSNGNPMSTSPSGALYIGLATTTTGTAPTSYTSYQWSLIKGTDGVAGETGADGKTSYLHIKYSNDGGATFTANSGEDVGEWIGTYVDFTQADSTNVATYTWNKVKGDDAYYVIVTGEQIFKYATGASTPNNTTIKLTAAPFNIDSPSYRWQYWDGTAWVNLSKSGYNTATYTVAYNDLEWAANDVTKRYRCLVNSTYSDEITISKLYDGAKGDTGSTGLSGLTVVLTNESHAIPTDVNGANGDYVGSGTQIHLYEGTTALTYDGTGTANGTWKITATGSGITASTSFTDSGSFVTVGNHSNMTANTATVTYTITGKRSNGTAISLSKTQTFSKAKTGAKGDNGSDAKVADILASSQMFKSTDGGVTFSPNTITLTPSLQNVTFSKWQYSTDGGSTFTDASGADGITIANNVLTLSKSSTLFSGTVTTIVFKLLTVDANVYDTLTIVKLYDVGEVEVGGVNMLPHTDFAVEDMSYWKAYNLNSQAGDKANITLDSGEVITFMRVRSVAGLAQSSTFGVTSGENTASEEKMSFIAGEKYTISFLVAAHSNATQNLSYTYLLNDGGTNQSLSMPYVTTQKLYGHMTTPFSLNVYEYSFTFTARDTWDRTRLLLGARMATDATGTTAYGLFYVSRLQIEKGNVRTEWKAKPSDKLTYTWTMYADDKNGSNMSTSPTGKFWRGRAFNKNSPTPSTTASEYVWEFITDGWVKSGTVKMDGGNIYADSLSVITANLGKMTAGEMDGVTLRLGIGGNGDLQVWGDLDGDGTQEVIGRVDNTGAYYPLLFADDVRGNVTNKYMGVTKTVYFNTTTGDDANDGTTWAKAKQNIKQYIETLPKNLNGKTITLYFRGNITGGFLLEGFHGGNLQVSGDTSTTRYKVYGYAMARHCYGGKFLLQGFDVVYDATSTPDFTLCSADDCDIMEFYSVKAYGNGGGKHGFVFSRTKGKLGECHVYNITDRGVYAENSSDIYLENVRGVAPIAMLVNSGSRVTGVGARWSGTITRWNNAIVGAVNSAGTGWQNDVWTIDTAEGTPTQPAPPAKQTMVVSASTGDNYSSQGFWTNDEVKQGNYGYGSRYALWYFDLSAIKGKTVSSATLTFYRNTGVGTSAARTAYLRSHAYGSRSARPASLTSGNYSGANAVNVSIAQGQTITVDVTNMVNLNIANGTGQSIGCFNGTSTDYMSLGLTPTLHITYS